MKLVSEIELRAKSLERLCIQTRILSLVEKSCSTTSRTRSVVVRHGVPFISRSGLRTTAIGLLWTFLR